jgi:PAS domain S-box-containing protein
MNGRDVDFEEDTAILSTLFETLPVGVTVLNPEGEIIRANSRAEAVLGLTESEITGRTYDDTEWKIVDEDGAPIPRGELPFPRVIDTGEAITGYQHGIQWPDGSERWLSINAAPITVDGTVDLVVAVISDITEDREHQESTRQQKERLEEFASVVSHDLRNPLNVAQGHVDLAQEEVDNDHLDRVERALDRMANLIEDLLTLAREGDEISDLTTVDVAELVNSCWQNVDTKGATLDVRTNKTIRADASRLQQLLENLIRNAVEHGGTDVSITLGDLEYGFSVEDDGPGIPECQREKVFKAGFSTSEQGSGFGLSIVKQVANAHGWEIRVCEGAEGGARFEITGVDIIDN